MKTWTHKGIEITFREQWGDFVATAGGQSLTAPSLDAIKAKIGKAGTTAFEPFDFIELSQDGKQKIVQGRVVALGKTERGRFAYGQKFNFVDAKGKTHRNVIRDTPENRKALANWRDTRRRNDRAIARLKNETEAAFGKIVREMPPA